MWPARVVFFFKHPVLLNMFYHKFPSDRWTKKKRNKCQRKKEKKKKGKKKQGAIKLNVFCKITGMPDLKQHSGIEKQCTIHKFTERKGAYN